MRKIIAWILTLVLLCPLIPAFPTEASQPEGDAAQVYGAFLTQHSGDMEAFEAQLRKQAAWNQGSVWFQDMTRDGVPEMILCRPTEGQSISLETGLQIMIQIYTAQDGSLQLLAQKDDIYINSTLGQDYMLFTLQDSPDLLLVHCRSGHGGEDAEYLETYMRISSQEDGSLQSPHMLDAQTLTDGYTGEESTNYFEYGKSVPQEHYLEEEAALLGQADRCLFCNGRDNWSSDWSAPRQRAYDLKVTSLSAADALTKLSSQTAETEAPAPQDSASAMVSPPASLSKNALALLEAIGGREYWFASGGGGWGDQMVLGKDGSFTGYYSYTNMGDEDPEYGTLVTEFYCNYTGQILEITPITETSYRCRISVTPDQAPDQVSRSQEDSTLKRVSVPLGGMADTDSLILYIPGQVLKDTPEDFQHWLFFTGNTTDKLENVGFYNPNVQSGAAFFASSAPESVPAWNPSLRIEAYNTSAVLDETCFRNASSSFDPNLAKLCAILSLGIEKGEKEALATANLLKPEAITSKNLDHFSNLGCMVFNKTMQIDGEETNVLFVVARGTVNNAEGFRDWMMQPSKRLEQYRLYDYPTDFYHLMLDLLGDHIIKMGSAFDERPVKIVVTGHSLGGAAANLLGAHLSMEDFWTKRMSSDDLFVYTFGSIDSLGKNRKYDLPVLQDYEYIHNIYNKVDTFGPNGNPWIFSANGNSGVGKFGHLDLFFLDYRDSGMDYANHIMECYIEALNQGLVVHDQSCSSIPKVKLPSEAQMFLDENVKPQMENSLKIMSDPITIHWTVRCPVDVEVLQNGQVIGGIRGDQAYTAEGAPLMALWAAGDTKNLSVPADCSLRITAYDTGTMTVTAQYYQEKEDEQQELVFSDVKLATGQVFTAAPDREDLQHTVLQTQTENGPQSIKADGSAALWLLLITPFVTSVLILLLVLILLNGRKKKARKGKFSR